MAKVLTGLTALLACLLLFPAASGRAATHPVHAIGSAGALLRKLFNPDPGGYNYLSDQFGWSVALSGTTAVIGARDVYSNSGAGAAYIYVKGATSWPRHPTVTLADPAGTAGDEFGTSVAIDGDTIVVGAPGAASGTGAAYVYVKGAAGWPTTPTATLPGPGGAARGGFGQSVAVSGGTVVVGAAAVEAPLGSAAYIYVKGVSGWPATPSTTLADPGAAAQDQFGWSVAVSGTTAIVGAPGAASFAGAAYVYVKGASGWPGTPATTLPAPRAGAQDSFGFAVAVSGTTAIVGAPARNPGFAYVYTERHGGWPSAPAVTLNDNVSGAGAFGHGVAVSGDTAIVGAPDTYGPTASGGAFFYVKGSAGWPATPTASVALPQSAGLPDFGWSAAVSGATALVGIMGANNGGGMTDIYQA